MNMNSNEMEYAFSRFLDSEDYDEAEAGLFAIVRLAFVTGWNAAKKDSIRLVEEQEWERKQAERPEEKQTGADCEISS